MAKTTDKQKELIDFIISRMNSWKNSNDLNSPTVSSDMLEDIERFYFDENKSPNEELIVESERLPWILNNLLNLVRKSKI
jgi:hypothetical protein